MFKVLIKWKNDIGFVLFYFLYLTFLNVYFVKFYLYLSVKYHVVSVISYPSINLPKVNNRNRKRWEKRLNSTRTPEQQHWLWTIKWMVGTKWQQLTFLGSYFWTDNVLILLGISNNINAFIFNDVIISQIFLLLNYLFSWRRVKRIK